MLPVILLFSLELILSNSIAHPVEQLLDSKVEYVRPKLLIAPIAPIPHKTDSKITTFEAQNAPIFKVDSAYNGGFAPSKPVEHKATFDLSPAESAWGGGCAGGCGGGWGGGGGWGHHHHHHHHGGWGHHGGGWGHHHHGWHHG